MKIAIFTLGTRGDVQPYAVLGQALQHHTNQENGLEGAIRIVESS